VAILHHRRFHRRPGADPPPAGGHASIPSRWKAAAPLALAVLFLAGAWARPAWGQATTDALAQVRIDKCRREAGRVVVSYHLVGALRPEDRKDLEEGQTLSFTHRVDIYRRRTFFADKWLSRRTVETTATLDTLTLQYTLTRKIDEGAVETKTTENPLEMEKWLSEVRNLPIGLPEDEGRGALEARVTTKYRKTFLLFVWPYDLPAKGSGECR
jgi:hypothetical protein